MLAKLKFSRPGTTYVPHKDCSNKNKSWLTYHCQFKKNFFWGGGGRRGLHCPFLWVGINCLKATESLWGDNLLFPAKFPEIPGTHLTDLVDPPIDFEHGTPR